MQTLLLLLPGIFLVRLLFRKVWGLPASNNSLADHSEIDNLMPEKQFWQLIHMARDTANRHYAKECRSLTVLLENLEPEQIIRFNRTFTTLMARSYSFRLWEPVYALNGGCSDDAFEYFREWLIGQGRNNFYQVVKRPRLLLLVGAKELIEGYQGLYSCARDAYENKTGRDLPPCDDISYAHPGRKFNENEAFLRYPELALLAW